MVQAGMFPIQFPRRSLGFSNDFYLSSRIMSLRSNQPLTEMSTRKLPGGKGRPAHKADNLTVTCELTD
jgi:hypothetical protein